MALIVGIDLGRKSAQDAVVLRRESAQQLGRVFRFGSTPSGIETLFTRIDAICQEEEPIAFVIDSPGKAWIPIAAVLKNRGYPIYRPSSYRVRKMRQAGDRKNKSNRIDALALARCLLAYPQDTQEVFLPQKVQAQLDQLVRQRDRIVDSLRRRKQRIQDLSEAINPGLTSAAGGFLLTEAGRAFLRTYLDPRAVVRLGRKRFAAFLDKRYRLPLEKERIDGIFLACKDAAQLNKTVRQVGQMPLDERLLQEEINWELDQLEREEQRVVSLENQLKECNQKLDPQDAFLSLPGIQHITAAGIRACIGDIDRFNSLTNHRGFAGLYPSVRKTGDGESASMPISKMSGNRYKRYLYLAAENAYKWDVDCAAFYHKRRERGHTHTQAVCAVANGKLLPRIHQLLKQLSQAETKAQHRPRYVFRDLEGNPISKAEARAIIQAQWGNRKYGKKGLATA
ncbi:MAG: IS110 family transposase [Candidatus Latescibacteria bacterium]|nr:IS110 family transposase [Candidatus Latescibacterota bacterium]